MLVPITFYHCQRHHGSGDCPNDRRVYRICCTEYRRTFDLAPYHCNYSAYRPREVYTTTSILLQPRNLRASRIHYYNKL
uniref:BPTI/Kunitz inhibitor domain-containing protein n=1 Tax=Steinernema glaseri TaxID=37863 RepID=A0A1I8AN74_9BILA